MIVQLVASDKDVYEPKEAVQLWVQRGMLSRRPHTHIHPLSQISVMTVMIAITIDKILLLLNCDS